MKDILTSINETKHTTCKAKWDEIKHIYGGVGSMSLFNTWVALMSTALDEQNPLLPQLQKLNDVCITLKNNDMEIKDLQFCFILIKTLPESYFVVISTILVTGKPKNLTPQKIQDWILNEECRRSGASTSFNKIALIKCKSDKADKGKIKCYYCRKKGYKSLKCWKKKRDLEEKVKKGKEKASNMPAAKSVNAHISTATIEKIDDNDNLPVSFYVTAQSQWMVDSGSEATHYITLHHSDFINWTRTSGVVSLGGHTEIN
jgi:gag-polypeptide of LTR copia-type